MERSTHGQSDGLFGTAFAGELDGAFDCSGVSGDDNLFRGVDVGGLTDFAVRGVVTNLLHLGEIHAEDGSHAANPDGNCFLHILSAIPYGADGVDEAQSAGGDVSGVLAEAMSGNEGGCESFFGDNAPGSD